MALWTLQETDTATGSDGGTAQCSPLQVATVQQLRIASKGASAGSGTAVVTDTGQKNTEIAFAMFPSPAGEPGLSDWAAGNWVIRLNITVGAAINFSWTRTYVCRVNSSDVSQGTVGSLLGQSIDLATTGVKTMTVSGAHLSGISLTDKIYIVLCGQTISAISQQFTFKPDQLIDTPLVAGSGGSRRGSMGFFRMGSEPEPLSRRERRNRFLAMRMMRRVA